jgi:raffinose/stachyose/melibiose transport system substrate-binding protein
MRMVTRREFLAGATLLGTGAAVASMAPSASASALRGARASFMPKTSLSGTLTILNRWTTPGQPKLINSLFAEFEKLYPGVSVKNQGLPTSGSTYQPAVNEAFASGSPPDMATDIGGPTIYALAQAGVLADITAFYKSTIAAKALGSAATEGAELNGVLYGINSDLSVGNLLWYNSAYLSKYGLKAEDVHTYDDLVAQCKAILKAGGTPIYLGAKDQWPGGHWLNDLVQRQLGDAGTNALYNRTVLPHQGPTPKWTNPAVISAFEKYVALKPYFQSGFIGEDSASADAAFLLGQSAYHEMGSWFLSTAVSAPPSFKVSAMLFPSITGAPGKATDVTLAASTIAISKKANLPLVEAFLNWFTEPAVAAQYQGIISGFSPYSLGSHLPKLSPIISPAYKQIGEYLSAAGQGGSVLYNDEAINANIYPKYIWEGSVGLMSGALTPAQLASQLEAATVADQAVDNKQK